MQKGIILIISLLLLVVGLKAQNVVEPKSQGIMVCATSQYGGKSVSEWDYNECGSFTFYGFDDKMLSLTLRESIKNIWGEEIAQYYAAFEDAYVYEEQPVDGDPNVIVKYRKPNIYKSIKGLETYLRKEMKKGNCSQDVANGQFIKILEVGIAAISEDSAWFERELKKMKRKEDQIKVYNKVILNRI